MAQHVRTVRVHRVGLYRGRNNYKTYVSLLKQWSGCSEGTCRVEKLRGTKSSVNRDFPEEIRKAQGRLEQQSPSEQGRFKVCS